MKISEQWPNPWVHLPIATTSIAMQCAIAGDRFRYSFQKMTSDAGNQKSH
jgi:hypothetical protein